MLSTLLARVICPLLLSVRRVPLQMPSKPKVALRLLRYVCVSRLPSVSIPLSPLAGTLPSLTFIDKFPLLFLQWPSKDDEKMTT
jgi:hypothetical protein